MGRAVLLEIQVRRDPPAHKFSSVQFTRTTHTVSKDGARPRPAPLPSVNTSAEYIHVLARSGYSNLRDLVMSEYRSGNRNCALYPGICAPYVGKP